MAQEFKKGYGTGRKQTLQKCIQAVVDYGENLLSNKQKQELVELLTFYAFMHKSAIKHKRNKTK